MLEEIVTNLASYENPESRFIYFINATSTKELSDTDKMLIMVYMYTNNVILFKLNIRLIIKKFGLELYKKFVIGTYLYNTIIDREFLEETILVLLCTDKLDMPKINFQSKEELKGLELANHKFAQSIAFKLYSNGKRSYYNVCKSYNDLIDRNTKVDYKQVILQKNLINLKNPVIESLYKLKTIQNVIIIPI